MRGKERFQGEKQTNEKKIERGDVWVKTKELR